MTGVIVNEFIDYAYGWLDKVLSVTENGKPIASFKMLLTIIEVGKEELLAGYIAGSVGNPKDFIITYSTTHNFSLQVKQYE